MQPSNKKFNKLDSDSVFFTMSFIGLCKLMFAGYKDEKKAYCGKSEKQIQLQVLLMLDSVRLHLSIRVNVRSQSNNVANLL